MTISYAKGFVEPLNGFKRSRAVAEWGRWRAPDLPEDPDRRLKPANDPMTVRVSRRCPPPTAPGYLV